MKQLVMVAAVVLVATACQQKSKKDTAAIEKDLKEIVENTPGINAGTGTYSIEAINGWQKTDTVFGGMRTTLIRSRQEDASDNFLENITIATEKVGSGGVEKYFDDNITGMKAQLPGFNKIKDDEITINNERAHHMVYTHSYTGTPIDVEAYFFVKNGIGYVVSCSVEKGKLAQWKPSLDKMVNTFVIN